MAEAGHPTRPTNYGALRVIFIVAAIVVFIIDQIYSRMANSSISLSLVLEIGMFVLNIIGCVYWAKYKGRNSFWGLFGVLGPIGWIVMACLRDDSWSSRKKTTGV